MHSQFWYRMIKNCYKHCASINAVGSLWCIGKNAITEILTQMGLLDGHLLTLSNLDIEYEKTNYSKLKFKNDTKAFMVRHNFLEMMVRLSSLIYSKQALNPNPKDVIKYTENFKEFFKNFCKMFFAQFSAEQSFRETTIWVEPVDYILKLHKVILDSVWKTFSGSRTLPGDRPWMSLDEYRLLIKRAGLEKEIVDRDINLTFNISIQTQVDELDSTRCFEMHYVEYLESICRLADKVSLPNLYYSLEEGESLGREERDSQPLCMKIEAL